MKNIKKSLKAVMLVFLISNICLFSSNIFAEELNNENKEMIKQETFNDISAPNVMLFQTDTGKILYEKNIDEKIYPASITKLMTAILVVENCNLDDIVTVSENAVTSVPSGYVNANLQVGEQLTVKDLLYVMLIPSANDAANALAEHVAGSIDSFSTMMNTRAKELGCTGSNFTNPSGLHQEEHYTTVRDLSFIAKEAISKNIIKKIVGTKNYTLLNTEKYEKVERKFTTTNYMKRKELSKYYCEYCIGGKTGYTGQANNCVVEYAEKNGIELTAIVMGEDSKIKGKKFLDAKEMFDYVYANYKNESIAKKNEECETIKIPNATKNTKNLKVLYKNNINIMSNKEILQDSINKNIKYTKITAPITKGEVIGKITYKYQDEEYSTELIAGEDVEENGILKNVLIVLTIILLIYILYNFKKSNKKKRRYKKNRMHGIYYYK